MPGEKTKKTTDTEKEGFIGNGLIVTQVTATDKVENPSKSATILGKADVTINGTIHLQVQIMNNRGTEYIGYYPLRGSKKAVASVIDPAAREKFEKVVISRFKKNKVQKASELKVADPEPKELPVPKDPEPSTETATSEDAV